MKKALVAYFSASGETEKLARTIAGVTGGALFEIAPETAYTAADLDWMDKKSRSTLEMNDETSRPAIAGRVEDMAQYDTVSSASAFPRSISERSGMTAMTERSCCWMRPTALTARFFHCRRSSAFASVFMGIIFSLRNNIEGWSGSWQSIVCGSPAFRVRSRSSTRALPATPENL